VSRPQWSSSSRQAFGGSYACHHRVWARHPRHLSSPAFDRGSGAGRHEQTQVSERPTLQTADIVVFGGRTLGSKEEFELVEQLADCLGAAVGASRAAVDAGYCDLNVQVGQTGVTVSPTLSVALGISGAIQHRAGMQSAKIIAINKDADWPIFEVADFGVVGDPLTEVPQLVDAVNARRG